MALNRSFSVLSKIERTTTSDTLGILYGGNSSTKEDGELFNNVEESTLDTARVSRMEIIITNPNSKVETMEEANGRIETVKNIVIIAIIVGNRPLHGTNTFVKIAISFSFGEVMILHPTIAAALHPNPIQAVNDCLPQHPALQNMPSRLNATLGRYPKSSRIVNIGKKIAIGGSITDTTHVAVTIRCAIIEGNSKKYFKISNR